MLLDSHLRSYFRVHVCHQSVLLEVQPPRNPGILNHLVVVGEEAGGGLVLEELRVSSEKMMAEAKE